jgi:hypothetical protein
MYQLVYLVSVLWGPVDVSAGLGLQMAALPAWCLHEDGGVWEDLNTSPFIDISNSLIKMVRCFPRIQILVSSPGPMWFFIVSATQIIFVFMVVVLCLCVCVCVCVYVCVL